MTINKINNKKYIGQHTKFNDDYLGSGKIIQLAIKKYGAENFERITLDIAYTQQELNAKEKHYIQYYDAIKSKEFYNIHVGGQGGDTFSGKTEEEKIEFKKKMSIVTKGENNGMYGKKHKTSSKYKIKMTRNANRDKYQIIYSSKEFKERMSVVTSGENNGMFGKKHSIDSKINMSKNSVGKTLGDKNGMYGMKNENALNGKKIYQYADENMTILINEFNSIICVLQYLGIKGHSSLYKALNRGSEYHKYYWSKEKKGVETIENVI